MSQRDDSRIAQVLKEAMFRSSEVVGGIASFLDPNRTANTNLYVNGIQSDEILSGDKILTLEEIATQLAKDYENTFWASGDVDVSLFATNCTFQDPFSSFGGIDSRDRFKRNADNFSKLIINPSGRSLYSRINKEENVISIGWIVSTQLKLPWKPTLAATGETDHYINIRTAKIDKYVEKWKSKPIDVILRLLKPTQEKK